ncbi:hypothetical protein ABZT34_39425 [Streptomyces sp. NPDC005329]|uniref:hypothetical protein n=1 Tax=Streptomyces sp. NPDC005329 TaxID=3157034 RepID=UPI0033A16070
MNTRTAACAALLALAALTGCSSSDDTTDTASKPAPVATTPSADTSKALKSVGIPRVPTGAARQALLDIIAKVNPDAVRYEDKAIDAARNQCASINGGGQRLDQSAATRFTYKDVTTTEAQGKELNEALKTSDFCRA